MRKLLAREGPQRNKALRSGERGQEKSLDAMSNGAGQDLSQRPGVTRIRARQSAQVRRAATLIQDARRRAVANEDEIHDESSDSPIAIAERVNPLEGSVEVAEVFKYVSAILRTKSSPFQPVVKLRLNVRPWRWLESRP